MYVCICEFVRASQSRFFSFFLVIPVIEEFHHFPRPTGDRKNAQEFIGSLLVSVSSRENKDELGQFPGSLGKMQALLSRPPSPAQKAIFS